MAEKQKIKENKEEKQIPEDKDSLLEKNPGEEPSSKQEGVAKAGEVKEETTAEAKVAERQGGFGGRGGFRGGGRPGFKRMTREERDIEDIRKNLEDWKPKTELGKQVREKKIKNIDEIIGKRKILESEIVDTLLSLESDLLNIGQSKGKFGGGKRRAWKQTQRKTKEGNVPKFTSMVVVGDKQGYVGLGTGKGKETLPARAKGVRNAKLNIMKIVRGCGSFDCTCSEAHSIPFIVEGKCGSSKIILFPAPQGTGLVIGDQCKKILKLAGIKDVYSKTYGQTKTTMNLARACIEALKKTNPQIKENVEGKK